MSGTRAGHPAPWERTAFSPLGQEDSAWEGLPPAGPCSSGEGRLPLPLPRRWSQHAHAIELREAGEVIPGKRRAGTGEHELPPRAESQSHD